MEEIIHNIGQFLDTIASYADQVPYWAVIASLCAVCSTIADDIRDRYLLHFWVRKKTTNIYLFSCFHRELLACRWSTCLQSAEFFSPNYHCTAAFSQQSLSSKKDRRSLNRAIFLFSGGFSSAKMHASVCAAAP
jgi:hypothetical protein